MKLPKAIKTLQVPPEQLQELLDRLRAVLSQSDYDLTAAMLNTVPQLLQLIAEKTMSIGRLRRMLFGKTETSANLMPQSKAPADEPRKPRPGHGRNGAHKYPGARTVHVSHDQVSAGDPCPACETGKIHPLKTPGKVVCIVAQPIFPATVYHLEKLRCGACGKVFTAKAPKEALSSKHDPSVGAQLGILRYGAGLPMNRIAELQENHGVPLPTGTQWDLIKKVAEAATPVFNELQRLGAQSPLFHSDDTTARILDVTRARKESEKSNPDDPGLKRTGLFTTSIVARSQDHDIVLYVTGPQHAGENMRDLLQKRGEQLKPPLLMCDALSRNVPKDFAAILINCNAHGRRQFTDIFDHYQEQCAHVIESFRQIYQFDAMARDEGFSPEQRLEFHQTQSGPVMESLQEWLQTQLADKLVEPNCSLGKAIQYLLKHWVPLTQFLHIPGAPLDNNICERGIKKCIRHRKNSLFYKTQEGAYVGDLFMSLNETCRMCQTNAFEYITALASHSEQLKQSPAQWLPWNYQTALFQATGA